MLEKAYDCCKAFFDSENTNWELKSDMKDLYIKSAVQIEVAGNRKAVVIHVPYRLRKACRKIHVRLVRELEKKICGKDVILIATRRIVRPPKKSSAVQRPRTPTLTTVHETMLEDIVLPAEIIGKRTRYRIVGSKIMKLLDISWCSVFGPCEANTSQCMVTIPTTNGSIGTEQWTR